MSEKILRALMQLFAIVANSERLTENARKIVENFLKQQLSQSSIKVYLDVFDDFLSASQGKGGEEKMRKRISVNSVKVLKICTDINQELNQRQKYIVLVRLIEFIHASGENVSEQEWEFVTTVSGIFNIPDQDFKDCLALAGKKIALTDSASFLLISNKSEPVYKNVHHRLEDINGTVAILFIRHAGISFLKSNSDEELTLNGQVISNNTVQVLTQGSVLRGPRLEPVYYSDIAHEFLQGQHDSQISFESKNLEYRFKNGAVGLHNLNFTAKSGELIGVMGGSGAGKSTLLNVLNGNLDPSSGEVLVNNLSIHRDKSKLEGVIGFIPQDDLLMEDLTVFQNLFYNTKLAFGNLDDESIKKKVEALLESLGLAETSQLKVGNSLDKTISGGQRKRLNIALELIREPAVLFVDEPTSGLSSRDSENVMDLLKQLANSGKLIFVVIHQPSSDIFKLFDKLLLLDTGGYAIYYGNPVDSLTYFRKMVDHVNAEAGECVTCGNINPEQLFTIIEAKVLDEFGNPVNIRKISAEEWNKLYLKNLAADAVEKLSSGEVKSEIKKPSAIKQWMVFIKRDVLSKLSNRQYLLINLLEAPLLAGALSFLIRYHREGGAYIFRENQNIPAYLFICVIVSLFLGMSVSAEEIFRDRKILKRESFLNLSRAAYLFSKIGVMFFLSALQTFFFALIGNSILGIHNMTLDYWLVLFTASCFANLVGLNISSAFNSAVTIYILIPILIIPQILLSGIIVKFEKLNPSISTHTTVPFFGEVMASRWAFEALAVNQFKNNEYERHFFEYDKQMSRSVFKKDFLIPELIKRTDFAIFSLTQPEKRSKFPSNVKLISNELRSEAKNNPAHTFSRIDQVNTSSFNEQLGKDIKSYLGEINKYYNDIYNLNAEKKERIIERGGRNGNTDWKKLKDNYQNENLEDLLKNAAEQVQIEEVDHTIVQRFQPVFMEGAADSFIQAAFFSSRKNVFGNYFETYWVNIAVIWSMTIIAIIALYFDWLKKLVNAGQYLKWRRSSK